ncbi:hypothetical protein F4776DRAFT_244388 [Hypoxylon sp. NC0597]|nr:hypothetical protein F4776DRAFT_244388 [Hypoxylon sp. NC0597]
MGSKRHDLPPSYTAATSSGLAGNSPGNVAFNHGAKNIVRQDGRLNDGRNDGDENEITQSDGLATVAAIGIVIVAVAAAIILWPVTH